MTCPKCGAIQRGPIDGKRIFFACESYGSTDDGKLRYQTDLCIAWETLNNIRDIVAPHSETEDQLINQIRNIIEQ
jgi:hypothetical protein